VFFTPLLAVCSLVVSVFGSKIRVISYESGTSTICPHSSLLLVLFGRIGIVSLASQFVGILVGIALAVFLQAGSAPIVVAVSGIGVLVERGPRQVGVTDCAFPSIIVDSHNSTLSHVVMRRQEGISGLLGSRGLVTDRTLPPHLTSIIDQRAAWYKERGW